MGIHLAMGVGVVLPAVIAASLLPPSAGPWRLAPVFVAVGLVGAVSRSVAAVTFVGTLAYLVVMGFLVNQYGVLSWHGWADVDRLAGMVAAAGGGVAVGLIAARVRRPPPLTVPPAWSAAAGKGPGLSTPGWSAPGPVDPDACSSSFEEEKPVV